MSIGSLYEYLSFDSSVVRAKIEGTKGAGQLAHDVGVGGIKLCPNADNRATGIAIAATVDKLPRAAAW